MSGMSFDNPRAALNAGMAVGMWRIERDDIIWRMPDDVESGVSFRGIATERDCPKECCGYFFIAPPEVVKAHQIGGME